MSSPILLTTAALAAAAGAALSPALCRLASVRTAGRPVTLELGAETAALLGVITDPRRYPVVAALTSADFAQPAHAAAWAALIEAFGADSRTDDPANLPSCARHISARIQAADSPITSARAALQSAGGPISLAALALLDSAESATAEDSGRASLLSDAQTVDCAPGQPAHALLSAGELIFAASDDRTRFAGADPLQEPTTADGVPVRVVRTAPRRRIVGAAAFTAMSFAAAPLLAHHSYPEPGVSAMVAVVLASLAILLASVTGLIISLVDHDTLFLDRTVLVAIGGPAYALAAVATTVDGHPIWVMRGLLLSGISALFLMGINWLFRMVRGMDGMGFGDVQIVLLTTGLPVVLSGCYTTGWYGLLAGMLVGIVTYLVRRVVGGPGKDVPFALGPHLFTGWLLAWALMSALNLVQPVQHGLITLLSGSE